jgi:uncharacterized protein YdaT
MDLERILNLISKESSDFVHEVSKESIQMVITHNKVEFKSTADRLKEIIKMIMLKTDYESKSKEQKLIIDYYIHMVKILVK